MDRYEQLKQRHAEQSARLGMQTEPQPPPIPAGPSCKSGGKKLLLVLVVLAVLAGGAGWFWWQQHSARSGAAIELTGLLGSGTGFFITSDGYLLTAAHVVGTSTHVVARSGAVAFPLKLIQKDEANDIALLKAEGAFAPLPIGGSAAVKLGAEVMTVGFPNPAVQGVSPKFTKGEISSLGGIQDDPRHFQISVPIQPGNSGGPLVTMDGQVVGLLVMRLNDVATLMETGLMPQNVNYALKSSYAMTLLEAVPGLKAKLTAPGLKNTYDAVVQELEQSTALVLVYR